jgi:hypothetical protein
MADWRTLDSASEHGQLLTECEVLKCDDSVSAANQRKRSEHDDERGQHELSCGATDHRIKMVGGDLILANHRFRITLGVRGRAGARGRVRPRVAAAVRHYFAGEKGFYRSAPAGTGTIAAAPARAATTTASV